MENVTKALLIAGAILIAVMILSLVAMAWSNMSEYYTEQHESTLIEQTSKFNDKFQNYKGKTIRGNELISIMNRVVDYNNSEADMVGYDRIIIDIDLKGCADQLAYSGRSEIPDYITNSSSDNSIRNITEIAQDILNDLNSSPGISRSK